MIPPHGGKIVNRVLKGRKREEALARAMKLPKVIIDEEKAKEVQNIAHGIFSPLEGFLSKDDFLSVLKKGRLKDSLPWTIPIVLDVSPEIKKEEEAILIYNRKPIAIFYIEEVYKYDKNEFAQKVFGTTQSAHPGVSKIAKMKEYLAGGRLDLIEEIKFPFFKYYSKPAQTRISFEKRGWKTVVGFQTRNIPHLGHEYCQKVALTFTDGLFINPVIGKKKKGDFKDKVIMETYKTLIDNYYPPNRVFLSILPLEMRYAGPREAILHAIIRKNFGCTHFIVGRDHAGVGNYYSPYAAQEIFKDFPDLEITPVFFRSFFYCKKCLGVVNEKICPHGEKWQINFSGTEIREKLLRGEKIPKEIIRPEVVEVISKWKNPFVE